MTTFEKSRFEYHGAYLTYREHNGSPSRFVARFKHMPKSQSSFRTFLIRNFTVEEYFARLDAKEAPLTILNSKGYIQPHIKKWLREAGLAPTPEGLALFRARRVSNLLDSFSKVE